MDCQRGIFISVLSEQQKSAWSVSATGKKLTFGTEFCVVKIKYRKNKVNWKRERFIHITHLFKAHFHGSLKHQFQI